jgi:chemotaxis family two-component system response regulator Rcp1
LEGGLVHRRKQPARVLLVEDDVNDALLISSVLLGSTLPIELETVGDGSAALAVLRDEEREPPHLILLDVGLPGISGFEVLDSIKADPDLACIPVVMLTQFDAKSRALQAYRHKVNSYIPKPRDDAGMTVFVERIASFWLDVAVLPDGSTGSGDG